MREIKFKIKYHRDDKVHGPYSANELCKRVPSNIENVGVMLQYTGLKDLNGKEIYEGDILKSECSRGVSFVVYQYGGFWFNSWMPRSMQLNAHARKATVIGNVHENPELIKL